MVLRQALDLPLMPVTFEAGVDLQSHRYRFVAMSSDQQIDPCPANGAGFLGILYDVDSDDSGGAAGDECNVLVEGIGRVEMAIACNPGASISSTASSGKGKITASGERQTGVALETSAGDGSIISVLIVHGGILA